MLLKLSGVTRGLCNLLSPTNEGYINTLKKLSKRDIFNIKGPIGTPEFEFEHGNIIVEPYLDAQRLFKVRNVSLKKECKFSAANQSSRRNLNPLIETSSAMFITRLCFVA